MDVCLFGGRWLLELSCISIWLGIGLAGWNFLELSGNPQIFFVCMFQMSKVHLVQLYVSQYIFIFPPYLPMPEDFPWNYSGCHHTFRRLNNRTQHYNAHHRSLSPDSEPDPAHQYHIKYHPKLNGMHSVNSVEGHLLIESTTLPCDEDGKFLPEHTRPPPPTSHLPRRNRR